MISEYFSNCYKSIITNKFYLFIITLLEYFLTIIIQIIIFIRKYDSTYNDSISKLHFHLFMVKIVNITPTYIKLFILLFIFILIPIYYYIFNKYSLNKHKLLGIIVMNIFEIFIFRFFFIIICHILFSIKNNVILLIIFIISIPTLAIIIHSFSMNHLYYFSPHIVVYPYDYFSSFTDIAHLIEKYLICISLQSSNINLNHFLFIIVFITQLICLFFSAYILYSKSYYIMSNIFLNKVRFSSNLSNILINIIMIVLGKENLKGTSFLISSINIYIICFIIFQVFYNPYNFIYFDTNEKIDNIYFYFYIIDHIKNQNFILEEKLEHHISFCGNCDLCIQLKKYLNSKFDYRKIFKILYKKNCEFSKLMNVIIHNLLVNGKESLKNNSYYLINIIICYYIYNKRKEYILNSNMKIIYEIINEENNNIQESHLFSAKQIFLLNEFFNKSKKILCEIEEILTINDCKSKIKKLLTLFYDLFDLKDKKYKSKLFYNKNEGIINFDSHISICKMIYEEIFNVIISNGGLPLKDNPIFLDELSKKSKFELNEIIIQLDILNFENKIIYIIGELSKYKDNALCQLFPNIFRAKQLHLIKETIMNQKFFKIKKDDNKLKEFFKSNSNNAPIQQYIDFHFVIYDKIDNEKKFRLINLRLSLIYPLNVTKRILLYGIYSIDKDIIITLDKSTEEKKEEYVLNYDDKEEQNELRNNILIKFKKNSKYYNDKKLTFVDKYLINPNIYNIYYINQVENQKKNEEIIIQNERNNLYDNKSKNRIEIYGESEGTNYNLLIQSTASTSTFTQMNNDRQGFKKRNKGGKKDNKKKKIFEYYQLGIIILSILILLGQISCHLEITNFNNNLSYQNLALTTLRNYYGVYNTLITSIFSLSCLTKESKGEECSSTFDLFEDFYIKETGNNFLSITQFISNLNKFSSFQVNSAKQRLLEILSNSVDENLHNLLNSKITSCSLSQQFSENNTKIILESRNTSFLDVLDYMTTGCLVMTSNYEYIKDNIYIINKINTKDQSISPFNHLKIKGKLSQYQIYFYFTILNYQEFVKSLDKITLQLIIKTSKLGSLNVRLVFIFLSLNLIFYLFLHFVLFLYIQQYFKLIADLLESIQSKLNLNNDNISVKELFMQKIQKLKIIISLYKQDTYQAIVDLNFIYDNYKKFVEDKNKEISKYLKKEKYINESVNINPKGKKLQKSKIKYIVNIPENKRLIFSLLATLIYLFILILSLCQLWAKYYSAYNRINALIKTHGNLSNDLYKLINYYNLMIYHNITIEDINKFENYNISNGVDIFSNMYQDIQSIYSSKRYMDKLGQYNLDNIDYYYNYTCKTYYEYLFKINPFLKMSNIKYKDFLIFVCEYSKIFKTNNYKQIFSIFIEYIQIGLNEINDRSYEGLTNIIHNKNYPKIVVFFLTVYNYALEILGSQIQRNSYMKINSKMKNYINTSFIIFYVSSSIFGLIIIFHYVLNLNSKYNKIHELKKVFKICNKKE